MKKLALLVIASSILLPSSSSAQQRTMGVVAKPGNTTTKHPDGSVEVRRPDGTIISEKKDEGKIFYSDGRSGAYFIGRDGQHYQRRTCSNGVGVPTCVYSDWIPTR
jgi:hypothetical protein